MKNFRKVLALVLVVATLFSFTAMASAAYKDAASINYDEAVAVLSNVGILNGYPEDGTFRPTNTITREEMAKMIAVLSNSGSDISTLYASACTFADVAKDRWSASYVAYCAKTGVVAGRSATTFDPTGKVTGLETAKMLLVVLGFNAEKQGYVGADWKVNVLRDAKTMGLLNGFAADFDIEAAIKREEAAQMMLNALEAPCVVGFLSNNHVTVTNALVFNGYKWNGDQTGWTKVSSYATLLDALKLGNWSLYGNVVISDDILYNTLFPNLVKTTGYDCFGRPAVVWANKNVQGTDVVIGSFVTAQPAKVYKGTAATLTTDFKAEADAGYKVRMVVDGKYTAIANDLSVPAAETGKGVLTEVYVDHANKLVHVVVINTYIGKVTNVNGRTGKAKVDGKEFTNSANLKEGTVVLYKVCNGKGVNAVNDLKGGKLHEVVKAEAKMLTVDETWTTQNLDPAKSWIVSGSDKYEYAKNLNTTLARPEEADVYAERTGIVNALADGVKLAFYTDEYGYIMWWSLYAEDVTYEYAYLVEDTTYGKNPTTSNGTDTVTYEYYGDMVDFAAKLNEDVRIDRDMYTLDTGRDLTVPQAEKYGRLVKYTVDDGVACLDAAAPLTANSIAADGKIDNLSVWCDDATQFLVRTYDYDKGDYVYTAYTGLKALPAGMLSYVYDGMGTLQYFASGNRATYVFLDAYYATAADYFVVLDRTNEVSVAKFDKLVEAMTCYTALVDGVESYVFTTTNLTERYELVKATVKTLTASYNGKPIYVATEHVAGVSLNGIETLDIKNGTIIIDTIQQGYRYDENSKVILLLKDGNGTASVSDDYLVLKGVKELEGFDGVTGYNMQWYKSFVSGGVLDTLYIWVEAAEA